MNRVKLPIATLLLVLIAGNTLNTVKSAVIQSVAVREKRFRSEVLQLPLTDESRIQLIQFLIAGGDRNKIGTVIVEPQEVVNVYEPLLKYLSNSNNLTLKDLSSQYRFRNYFKEISRDVIDANQPDIIYPPPIAGKRGRYWWIFYHSQNYLTKLLVVRAKSEPER